MMKCYFRLDDACEWMNHDNWKRMESILDKYGIKPLVGIIPKCEDLDLKAYQYDAGFWERTIPRWLNKGWIPALHGFNHVCSTKEGGINPIHNRSEFAGLSLEKQKEKIHQGLSVLKEHGIEPEVFFAPSHTFDLNTLKALKECSSIRIISDTIASQPYCKNGFTFIPQQSGKVRSLPFDTVTFCYHPNTMEQKSFTHLEAFLKANNRRFAIFPIQETNREPSKYDLLLKWVYFHLKEAR